MSRNPPASGHSPSTTDMPLKFTKQLISAETFEAAGVFDVEGDRVLDIVSGGFCHQRVDFRRKHLLCANSPRFDDNYDDFSVIAMDINSDGRLDVLAGGLSNGETFRSFSHDSLEDIRLVHEIYKAFSNR